MSEFDEMTNMNNKTKTKEFLSAYQEHSGWSDEFTENVVMRMLEKQNGTVKQLRQVTDDGWVEAGILLERVGELKEALAAVPKLAPKNQGAASNNASGNYNNLINGGVTGGINTNKVYGQAKLIQNEAKEMKVVLEDKSEDKHVENNNEYVNGVANGATINRDASFTGPITGGNTNTHINKKEEEKNQQ